MKELSNDLKMRIVKCLEDGMPQRKVSLLLQCGQSTVCDTWKKYCVTKNVENCPQRGRLLATLKNKKENSSNWHNLSDVLHQNS